MFTPSQVIANARGITNDNESGHYRQSDPELLGYFNDGIKAASVLVPNLFYEVRDFTCAQNKTEQKLTYDDVLMVLDVVRIKDGKAVIRSDFKTLSQFKPDWHLDTAAEAINWDKNDTDPLRFYIYPKAPEMQLLEVLCVRNPITYAINDEVSDLPDSTIPALTDYIVFRAESKDDEAVNSNRSAAFFETYRAQLTGSASNQGAQ